MEDAVNRYLNDGEQQLSIFQDYKKDFTSFETFKLKLNKLVENRWIRRFSHFPNWIYKNDGIWTPATYEQLSPSEKDIYNARANRDFLP